MEIWLRLNCFDLCKSSYFTYMKKNNTKSGSHKESDALNVLIVLDPVLPQYWILSINVWIFHYQKFFLTFHAYQTMCSLFQNHSLRYQLSVVILWSPDLQEYSCGHLVCAGIFLHSPVLLCGHIGLNKTKHRIRLGIFTLNSLLTAQFNVPQKCYEFKLNPELVKTCVNAMNTLQDVISHEIVVWIFCCQNFWITQASNLEIIKILWQHCSYFSSYNYCPG